MHRSPARRLLGVVCGTIAVASVAMVVPAAVAEPGWRSEPAAAVTAADEVAAGPAAAGR